MKNSLTTLIIGPIVSFECAPAKPKPAGMDVEFMNHAACAYIAVDKGWFEEEGLKLNDYESYSGKLIKIKRVDKLTFFCDRI